MAVSYQQLLHDTALRMNALVGTQFAALETTYATATLTASNFRSADWPFSSFRDAILMAVGDFIAAIAHTAEHPERPAFESNTATVLNNAVIPSTNAGSLPIIGAYGAVVDSSDGNILDPYPLAEVRRIVAETWRLYPLYLYAFNGGRIAHTRPSVVIRVCTFDRTAQLTAFNAAGNMPLADYHESGVVAQALRHLTSKATLRNAVDLAPYTAFAEEALAVVRAGIIATDAKPLPPIARSAP